MKKKVRRAQGSQFMVILSLILLLFWSIYSLMTVVWFMTGSSPYGMIEGCVKMLIRAFTTGVVYAISLRSKIFKYGTKDEIEKARNANKHGQLSWWIAALIILAIVLVVSAAVFGGHVILIIAKIVTAILVLVLAQDLYDS